MRMQKTRAICYDKNMCRVVGFKSHEFFDFMSMTEQKKGFLFCYLDQCILGITTGGGGHCQNCIKGHFVHMQHLIDEHFM